MLINVAELFLFLIYKIKILKTFSTIN
jgi:hypothetical protein